MKYGLVQMLFCQAFRGTFTQSLMNVLRENEPRRIIKEAQDEYKSIACDIDEFDREDIFLFNILSATMLSAALLHMTNKPTLDKMREYNQTAINSNFFMRIAAVSKKNYTSKGRAKLKKAAEQSQLQNNPYSLRFTVIDGDYLNSYTTIFTTCDICYDCNYDHNPNEKEIHS